MSLRTSLLAISVLGCLIGLSQRVSAQNLAVYSQYVSSLQRDGVIQKGPLVDLRLSEGINRAEALKVILRSQPRYASSLRSITDAMPPLSLFPDVDQLAWYAPFIEIGFQSKLVTGYPDGLFRPERGVKVEEAAAMLVRAFAGKAESTPFMSSSELRNDEGRWYTNSLSILNSRGAAVPGTTLRAGMYLTRGAFFTLAEQLRSSNGIQPTQLSVVPSQSQPKEQIFIGGDSGAMENVQIVDDSAALQYASKKSFAISIPSLSITDLTITHPKDAFSQDGVLEILKNGVGHLFAYPGEGSKIMIYGHSSGYPWDLSKYTKIFRTINKISIGSRVYVTHLGKVFVYQVIEKKTIPAKDRSIFESGDKKEELILYTCWPPDSIAERYIVRAVPVETIALK